MIKIAIILLLSNLCVFPAIAQGSSEFPNRVKKEVLGCARAGLALDFMELKKRDPIRWSANAQDAVMAGLCYYFPLRTRVRIAIDMGEWICIRAIDDNNSPSCNYVQKEDVE